MRRVLILAPALALLAHTFSAHAAPDEELLGKSAGYPIGTRATWFYDERVRVGSFSRLDEILPHNTLQKSATPMALPTACRTINRQPANRQPACNIYSGRQPMADSRQL